MPTISVTASYSDVRNNESLDQGAGFISRVSPGLQYRSRTGRVTGALDYSLNATHYSRDSSKDTVQNALTAAFSVEALPGYLYVDTQASISQQSVSLSGQQTSTGSFLSNPNQTEMLTLQVSPYYRGPIGDFVEVEARLRAGGNKGRQLEAYDSSTSGGSLALASRANASKLRWSLVGSQQTVDFRSGRATINSSFSAGVSYSPDADITLQARGGQETTDVNSFQKRRYDNWGLGVKWTPSPRTLLSVDADRRYFGTSHQITLEHRWKRALFRLTSARDATTGSDATGIGQPVTLYQLYFAQFASIEPDPALRELLVMQILRAQGLDPGGVVAGGALTTAVSLQKRQDLALIYTGLRTTVTLQAYLTVTQLLDDPTAQAGLEPLRKQRGLLANISHRLTPRASLNFSASSLTTRSVSGNTKATTNAVSAGLTNALGPYTTTVFSTTLTDYNDGFNSAFGYREITYTASLNLRF